MVNYETIKEGILETNKDMSEFQVNKYLLGLMVFFGSLCFPAYELFFMISRNELIGVLAILLTVFLGVSIMDYSSKNTELFDVLYKPFILYVVCGVVFVGIGFWIKMFF